MKRLISAILAVLYICTSTGATIHMHYCMGEIAGWDFSKSINHTCEKCGMLKDNGNDDGCCKDELKQLKIENDQKTPESYFQVSALTDAALLIPDIVFSVNKLPSVTEENPRGHDPPPGKNIPVYLLNCVFRI